MHNWNQIDYILCSQRQRSSIQSAKTRPGADYGSDHELLIAKFRLKLKKVEKTTGPFSYDLNQTPYDYTVEVRNRFKGLDLIECLMNYGRSFVTLYRRQESRPSPRKMKKSKMALWGGLTNSCEKTGSEKQRRKVKIHQFECRVPKNSKKRYESLPQQSMQEIEENNRMGNTRDPFKKIRDTKGTFHAKMGSIKDRNGMDQRSRRY